MPRVKNKLPQLITEDRISQKIALEILINRCDDMKIGEAKSIARTMSVKIRNAMTKVRNEKLRLSDEQANSESFWISMIVNSGKDFNQPSK